MCTRVNGCLVADEENLEKVKAICSLRPFLTLISIVSIIGEKGSGKTTYTNLLIQNLRHNSTGGWLEKVTKGSYIKNQDDKLPGFPIRNKSQEHSQVGLWPEPFYVKHRGVEMMVLVAHVQYTKLDPRSKDVDSLEVFLSLLSSKLVEVHWKNPEVNMT